MTQGRQDKPEGGQNPKKRMPAEAHGRQVKPQSGPRAFAEFLHAHQKQLALVAAGLCVVIAAALTALVLTMPKDGDAVSVSGSSPGSTGSRLDSAVSAAEAEADDVPTVLPETEDAGMEYVEETLFLGDSNTERMLYYSDVTGVTVENGFGVVGMGISTFTTTGVARFMGVDGNLTMPQVVELLQPRRVVMTFGTNNVGMDIDRFITDYKKAVAAVKNACRYADIIIGAIFPVDQYRQNTSITMERIDAMNEALIDMCEEEGIKFLRWGDAIYDKETGYSLFEATIQDGVHLSRSGMSAIFEYLRTHSYITKDRRPTPLKTAPQRIAQQPDTITQDGRKQAGPIDWEAVEAAKSPVTVVFSAWDETNNTAGGGSVSPGSVTVKPGGTSGSVTATAKEGYTFVGWSFASGTSGGAGSTTSITVDSGVTAGSSLTVTAVFRQTAAASSSSSSSSSLSPSSSNTPPAVSSQSQPPADSVVSSIPASPSVSSQPPASSQPPTDVPVESSTPPETGGDQGQTGQPADPNTETPSADDIPAE